MLLEHELALTVFSPQTKKSGVMEAPPVQDSKAESLIGPPDSSAIVAEFVEPFLMGKACLKGVRNRW